MSSNSIDSRDRTYNIFTDNDKRKKDTSDALVEFEQGYRLVSNYNERQYFVHGGLVKNPCFGKNAKEPEYIPLVSSGTGQIVYHEEWVLHPDAKTRDDLPAVIWRLILLCLVKMNPTDLLTIGNVARTCRGFRAVLLPLNNVHNPQYRLKTISRIFILFKNPLSTITVIPDKTINPMSLDQAQPQKITQLFSDQNGRSIHQLNDSSLLFTNLSANLNPFQDFTDTEIEVLNEISDDPSMLPASLNAQTVARLTTKFKDAKAEDFSEILKKAKDVIAEHHELEIPCFSNKFNPTYKISLPILLAELQKKFAFIDPAAQSFDVHAQLLSETTFALSINSYLLIGKFYEKHIPVFEDCFDYTNTPIQCMAAMPDQSLMISSGNVLIRLSISNHATHLINQFTGPVFSSMTFAQGALRGLDPQGNTRILYLDNAEGRPLENPSSSSLYPQRWIIGHNSDAKLQVLDLEREDANSQKFENLEADLGALNDCESRSYQLFGDLLFLNYANDLTIVYLPTKTVLKKGSLIDLFRNQLDGHNIYTISTELVGNSIRLKVLSNSPENNLTHSEISTVATLTPDMQAFTSLDKPQAPKKRDPITKKEAEAKRDRELSEIHEKNHPQLKTPLIPVKPITPAPESQAHKIALIFGAVLLAITAINVASFMVLQTGAVCFAASGIIVTLPAVIAFGSGVPLSLSLIAIGSILWLKNKQAKRLTA